MPWHNIPREVIPLKFHLFKSLETRQNPDISAKIPNQSATKLCWLCFIWTLKCHSVDSVSGKSPA